MSFHYFSARGVPLLVLWRVLKIADDIILDELVIKLFKEKAAVLGVKYSSIWTSHADPRRYGGLTIVNEQMSVDMDEGKVTIKMGDPDSLSEDSLSLAVEFNACHCRNMQDGMFRKEIMALDEDLATGLALEMYSCYTEYFASKLHISAFGQSNFDRFQMNGLAEFCGWLGDSISTLRSIGQDPLLQISAYFKEQVKCFMMSSDPGIIPPVISQITSPFPAVFEAINDLNIDWLPKSCLLYVFTSYIKHSVALGESLQRGHITLYGPEFQPMSKEICQGMKLPPALIEKAQTLENFARDYHVALGKGEELPELQL
jgi:hypothetical protein